MIPVGCAACDLFHVCKVCIRAAQQNHFRTSLPECPCLSIAEAGLSGSAGDNGFFPGKIKQLHSYTYPSRFGSSSVMGGM